MPRSALPPDDACVIFWGSLGAAYAERVAARWTPGAIGDPDRFRCSVYHSHLGALLANQDSVFTTVRALVDDPAAVLRSLGVPAEVFVRPDSALKPFSGRLLTASSLTLDALDHGYYYDDDQLPIVVSAARAIGREWRFVLAGDKVIAGCEYGADRLGRGTDVPEPARRLAETVARAPWQPAPIYILDVGEVAGAVRVMELNPFSGADLYQCDAAAVVGAATIVALGLL
jgi:ATP-grasp domain, R2K clade family 3